MRIVIDGRMISWPGIGRYTSNLLRELQRQDHSNEYIVLLQQKDWAKFTPTSKNFSKKAANIEPYSLTNQTRLPGILKKLRPDLVHFPHFIVPLAYNGPYVVSIHDLTLLDFRNVKGGPVKGLVYSGKQVAMKQVFRHAIKSAKRVIASTKFGEKDIRRRFRVPDRVVTVVPLAAEVSRTRSGSVSVKRPYIMYTGSYYPYKNVGALLEAFVQVKKSHPDLSLVLTGPDDFFQHKLRRQAAALKLGDSVNFAGYVEDEELAALYKNAELFVFPSLAEGFGLPPLEAMAHGTPVLSSSASCMPEVLGDAAIYFDPKNVGELAEEIDAALNSPDELKQMRQAGPKQAAKYSWRNTAEQTLEVYTRALR